MGFWVGTVAVQTTAFKASLIRVRKEQRKQKIILVNTRYLWGMYGVAMLLVSGVLGRNKK